MPFIKADPAPETQKAYEEFQREYDFRMKSAKVRKINSLLEKERLGEKFAQN